MEKLIAEMQKIGFTGYEAKVYLALLRQNPATAYELGKLSGVPQAKVYETVARLARSGVLQALDSEPVKYVPLSPEDLLARRQRDFGASIALLRESLPQQGQVRQEYVWNICGRAAMLTRVLEVIDRSQREVLLTVWPPEALAIRAATAAAAARGVKVRAVVYGTAELAGEIYRHGGEAELRRRANGSWLVLTADGREAVIGQIGADGEALAVWTGNRGIVFVTRRSIEHEIYIAREMDGKGADQKRQAEE